MRGFGLGIVALALALLPGVAGTAPAQVAATIDVYNFDFGVAATNTHVNPTILVGQTVRWTWVNGFHSTTAAAGQTESWNSGDHTPSPPFTFDHTFTHTGTFRYYCDIHGSDIGGGNVSGMSGFVTVNPVPEPASLALAACGVGGVLAVVRRRKLAAGGEPCAAA